MAGKGVNKVIIIGNLGADPEVRQFPNGGSVCNLRIATSETWKDKQTGQAQERTEWHTVSFFGKAGEIIAQYAKKGSKLYVEGSLRTRKWTAKDGTDRYSTEIAGAEFQFLSDNRSAAAPAQQTQGHSEPQAHDTSNDDDIPF